MVGWNVLTQLLIPDKSPYSPGHSIQARVVPRLCLLNLFTAEGVAERLQSLGLRTRRLQHASECCAHCHVNFKYVSLLGNCRITAQWLKMIAIPNILGGRKCTNQINEF